MKYGAAQKSCQKLLYMNAVFEKLLKRGTGIKREQTETVGSLQHTS